MKIELEIDDFEEFYTSYYEEESITGRNFKNAIINIAVQKFVDQMYNNYMCDRGYSSIKDDISKLVKEKSGEIIDKVTENVTNEIIKKKAIVEKMPKKSEINSINKEWEQYFIELIDKAIAKRFK